LAILQDILDIIFAKRANQAVFGSHASL